MAENPKRRRLTGEGMTLMEQVYKRLVPCPQCLTLCRIQSYKSRKLGKGRGYAKIVRLHCHQHGLVSVRWEAIPEILKRREAEQASAEVKSASPLPTNLPMRK